MDTSRVVAGATVSALWQITGHYIPLAKPYEHPNVPSRLGAYIYGTTGILLGVGIAFGWRVMLQVFGMAVPAGIVTISAYIADSIATAPTKAMVRHGLKS